jgi:hypothetical protein
MSSADLRGSLSPLPAADRDPPPGLCALRGPVGSTPRTAPPRRWREPRFACRVACRVRELEVAGVAVLTGQTVNISRGGLALLVAQALQTGARVEVLLPCPQGEGVRVTGEVAHCRRVLSGTFEVGVRLERAPAGASALRPHP